MLKPYTLVKGGLNAMKERPVPKYPEVEVIEGNLLDLWVARAGELDAYIGADGVCYVKGSPDTPYQPSTNWGQGGPILETSRVEFERHAKNWFASIDLENGKYPSASGPSQLVAGMRAFLRLKYGDKVPDEQYEQEKPR